MHGAKIIYANGIPTKDDATQFQEREHSCYINIIFNGYNSFLTSHGF